MEMTEKPLSSPMVNTLTPHEANGIYSESLIFNASFTNKEYYDYVHKICNNSVIFHKFRTWMKEELKVNSAVKILEKELLLLDTSLTITPKQQVVYGIEPPHSPVRDVKNWEKISSFQEYQTK